MSAERVVVAAVRSAEVRALVEGARGLAVIAVGKAAAGMLAGWRRESSRPWRVAIGVGPGPAPAVADMTWYQTAHPVPDTRSVVAARAVLDVADALAEEDLLVVLLSGGASALMALPAEGLSLDDKRAVTARLLAEGTTIRELNTVRTHLSAIKGGRLAAATPARVLTLALSDVVGDHASTIGSGPTVADPTTFADAYAVLVRRGGLAAYPPAVVAHLSVGMAGAVADTPKQFDENRVTARVIGSNAIAVTAAASRARALGYRTHVLPEPVVGDARAAGRAVIRAALALRDRHQATCVLAGGETTVRVTGQGRGGRNQECALQMAIELDRGVATIAASLGTDGIDGPTNAAGGLVDQNTMTRIRAAGIDAEQALVNNDSYPVLAAIDGLIVTGPTGTNVGDMQIVLMAPAAEVSRV